MTIKLLQINHPSQKANLIIFSLIAWATCTCRSSYFFFFPSGCPILAFFDVCLWYAWSLLSPSNKNKTLGRLQLKIEFNALCNPSWQLVVLGDLSPVVSWWFQSVIENCGSLPAAPSIYKSKFHWTCLHLEKNVHVHQKLALLHLLAQMPMQ